MSWSAVALCHQVSVTFSSVGAELAGAALVAAVVALVLVAGAAELAVPLELPPPQADSSRAEPTSSAAPVRILCMKIP